MRRRKKQNKIKKVFYRALVLFRRKYLKMSKRIKELKGLKCVNNEFD
jgi:hypothetical protein